MAVGGPFTREDPANKEIKTCLDVVIVSINILPFVRMMIIDNMKEFTPNMVVKKGKELKITYTDH